MDIKIADSTPDRMRAIADWHEERARNDDASWRDKRRYERIAQNLRNRANELEDGQ